MACESAGITLPLSLTGRRWQLPVVLPDFSEREGLVSLWKARGLHPAKSISLDDLHSAFHYPDLLPAAERVRQAVIKGERVLIIGDYDCDGITSTALLVRAIRRLGLDPAVRLPHRVKDGYGLTQALAAEVAPRADLIITVDTGVTALEAVADLRGQGIDVIIVDHHHPPAELPAATALIHPITSSRQGAWPSAAGLAYLFGQAISPSREAEGETDLALGMLGTIADVVPLVGFNRSLASLGLAALDRLPSGPLAEMRDALRGKAACLSSTDIAFRLAPRINAAGRLADPTIALSALLEGGAALTALEDLNTDRQRQTRLAVDRTIEKMLAAERLPSLLAVAQPDLHPGVLGLVAAKLTEQFGRPSLVVNERNGLCTASLRGPATYHLAEGLEHCADLLDRFGGHAQAAGCTFKTDRFDALVARLDAHIQSRVAVDDLVPTLTVDGLITIPALTPTLIHDLSMFEPFGAGNHEPRVLIKGVTIDGARTVGENDKHLQGRIGSAKLIGFNLGHMRGHCDQPLDLVGRLGIDAWNGRETVQLMLDDARLAQA